MTAEPMPDDELQVWRRIANISSLVSPPVVKIMRSDLARIIARIPNPTEGEPT